MKMMEVKCPNCNGQLSIAEDRADCYCEYCGTHILIDDGVKRTINIIRDEAKLKELEEDREIRRLKEELARIDIEKTKYETELYKHDNNPVFKWLRIILKIADAILVAMMFAYPILSYNKVYGVYNRSIIAPTEAKLFTAVLIISFILLFTRRKKK